MNKSEILKSQDWNKITEILLVYAGKIACRKSSWKDRYENDAELVAGVSVRDIIQDAIATLFNEEEPNKRQRVWDPEKEPDILLYLFGVIRSLLSNLATSKENKLSSDEDISDDDCKTNKKMLCVLGSKEMLSPEEYTETTLLLDKIKKLLEEKIGNDEHLTGYLMCYWDGLKRSECADFLELPVKEIDNIKKRFFRILNDVIINNDFKN